MKILLVTEDVPASILGGAGKHAVLLGNALIEAGHDVELLGCLRQAGVDTNNDFRGKLHATINMRHIGLKEVALGIFNPLRLLLIAWRIWSAIKRLPYQQFDVIHYHGHTAELGVLVPKNINYVHTLHDQGSECMTMLRFRNGAPCKATSAIECAGCATKNKPKLLQKIFSTSAVKLHRYLARQAFSRHKAIFVSEFVRQRFLDIVDHADELNTHVIHNFTDARSIRSLLKLVPSQKPNNLRPVVLVAGRVHVTKGQALFLEVLPDSLLEQKEVRIVGDGPDLAMLREKHEKRGVKFLGWLSQEEVYKETMQADFCVVPSIWEEPCGTVSLEALAIGKVVFALARGGNPEQMRYCSYPNQLRLFDDMASLVSAMALTDDESRHQSVNLKADITSRLPEILDVYSKLLLTEINTR